MSTASRKVNEYIAERATAGQLVSPGDCLRLFERGRRLDGMTLDELDREKPLDQGGPFAGFLAGLVRTLRDEAGKTPDQIAAEEARDPSSHGGDEDQDPPSPEDLAAVATMKAKLAAADADAALVRRAAVVRSELYALRSDPQRSRNAVAIAKLQGELASLEQRPQRSSTADITSAEAIARARARMAAEGDVE